MSTRALLASGAEGQVNAMQVVMMAPTGLKVARFDTLREALESPLGQALGAGTMLRSEDAVPIAHFSDGSWRLLPAAIVWRMPENHIPHSRPVRRAS